MALVVGGEKREKPIEPAEKGVTRITEELPLLEIYSGHEHEPLITIALDQLKSEVTLKDREWHSEDIQRIKLRLPSQSGLIKAITKELEDDGDKEGAY